MKITKKQLSELINEEFNKQTRLVSLREEKARIIQELQGFDDFEDPADSFIEEKLVDCHMCMGTGVDEEGEECYHCEGTGQVDDEGNDEDPYFEYDNETGGLD